MRFLVVVNGTHVLLRVIEKRRWFRRSLERVKWVGFYANRVVDAESANVAAARAVESVKEEVERTGGTANRADDQWVAHVEGCKIWNGEMPDRQPGFVWYPEDN